MVSSAWSPEATHAAQVASTWQVGAFAPQVPPLAQGESAPLASAAARAGRTYERHVAGRASDPAGLNASDGAGNILDACHTGFEPCAIHRLNGSWRCGGD